MTDCRVKAVSPRSLRACQLPHRDRQSYVLISFHENRLAVHSAGLAICLLRRGGKQLAGDERLDGVAESGHSEKFKTLRTAGFAEVLRGVAFTPQSGSVQK